MKISPSLLSADFSRLYDEAASVEGLVDRFHWDVMDGHFVPNLTFGPPVVNALRSRLRIPFDIHLMIDDPLVYAPQFDVHPDDSIIIHIESRSDATETLRAIADRGARCGITLRPGTSLETVSPYLDLVSMLLVMSVEPGFGGQAFLPDAVPRIRALKELIGDRTIDIAVDGGINPETIGSVAGAGADIAVAGSAIFRAENRENAIRKLREAAA